MKLLRFGFEGEVVPSEVTITQGLHCHPGGLIARANWGYNKSNNPTNHKWHSDNPGDEGCHSDFRQDYTDLSKWPGAYVFETGREGIPGSKALRGWWYNDGYGQIHTDASGRIGQNINVPLLKSLFPNPSSEYDAGDFGTNTMHQCQNMNIKVPVSDGLAGTYFFKAAKVYGIDATGLYVPEIYGNQGADSQVGTITNSVSAGNNYFYTDESYATNAPEYVFTYPSMVASNSMWVKPPDNSFLNRSWGCIGMLIPRPGTTRHSDPYTYTNTVPGPTMSANITASNWNFYSSNDNIAAGFILYAASSDVLTTYGQPSPTNDVVMVDTMDIYIDGEKTTVTLEDPINVREWINVAFKYTRNPNHMFSLQINGQKYEVYGSPSTEDIGSTALRYISFPLHFDWAWTNTHRISNAIAYDDIAINNNVVKNPINGETEFSDSESIIPGFIRCTGLELTSEVAGNTWNYEGADGLSTVTGEDDVRLYTDTTALNRYRFTNIPASLTGLESINIGVKNTNISFPSKIKYIGFGLETGNIRLLGDFAASRIGELTNTEGDHSASLIVDPNYPSAFQALTSSDLASASIYVEAKKQMGLNFFGLGNFNGTNDINIKGAYASYGQVRNNYTDATRSDPWDTLIDNRNAIPYGNAHNWSTHGGNSTMQAPLPRYTEESTSSNAGPFSTKNSNDADLVLHAPIDPDKMGTVTITNKVPDLGISQYTIIPRHFKNRAAEIHTKNFVVSKNTSLNISLGNWKFDDQPQYTRWLPSTDRKPSSMGQQWYNENRIWEVDARPNPQYGEFDDYKAKVNGSSPQNNTAQVGLEYNYSQTTDGANYGGYMDAKNHTNQTPSVVIIYAKENIYIDGDVYFDYGDGIHHAPTEHTYHSKDNSFRIIKFSGENDFNFDVDTLIRSNNTAFSESIYQHHTPTVLDVGDTGIPTDGTVTAIDFSLEAGERQGIVQHGSGGACGDVFGTDSEGRSVHGTNAIGWGCGGGGGLVTGWTDNQGNTLFPMLGLKNTFKSDMPKGLYPLFRAQYGLRSAQYYSDSSTVNDVDGGALDYNTYKPTGETLFSENAGNGIPCIQLRGLGPEQYNNTNEEPQMMQNGQAFEDRNAIQWYDASDPAKVVNERNAWWYKAHHHPVIGQSILGYAGPVPTTTCAFPGYWSGPGQGHGDWHHARQSIWINYGYTHHIATALFKDLFVNQNPNEGWRYDSPARTGYAGGPWGGGRGASWTHKKWGDEVLGIHNAQPTLWTSHKYDQAALSDWTQGGNGNNHLDGNIVQSEFKHTSQYHPDNHAGGYRQTDIYTCPQNIANFGDPEGTSYGFVNYKGTSVGGGSKDSFFAARAYNWQKKDGSKCGSYEWLTNSDYVSNLNVSDIPYLGHARHNWLHDASNHGFYSDADSKNPNREVNPKSTSPALNDNDVVQAWGGSSSLATCGRGGAGGVIVYLIAGGDIIIGPNGKVHARGGHAGGWLDGKYDAPSTITHAHNRFKWCESQARASYSRFASNFGTPYMRAVGSEQINGTVYGSQSLGYLGNDYLTINMAGHGGGGGGCITFLHGGLFKNFGTVDVQGAGSEDHQMAASAFWGWTGDGTNPTWGSQDTSGTFQYWSKHNWNYRNFDVNPRAATGVGGFAPENDYTGIIAGIESDDNSVATSRYPYIGYICNPKLENYFGEGASRWGNDMCQWHAHDLINRGFTGFCYAHNTLAAFGVNNQNENQQWSAQGRNNYLIYHPDNRYNPNYIAGNGTATLFRRIQLPYMITGAGTEISQGFRADGVPNLCQLQIDETSLKDNPNVVMYPRGGAGAWRNFKIIGNYDNKRSI